MWLDVSDEPPILNGFGEVLGLDVFTVFQVSDGSSGFEYLIVGTGDQTELVNCSNSYQLGPMGWRCATWRRCWDGPASKEAGRAGGEYGAGRRREFLSGRRGCAPA